MVLSKHKLHENVCPTSQITLYPIYLKMAMNPLNLNMNERKKHLYSFKTVVGDKRDHEHLFKTCKIDLFAFNTQFTKKFTNFADFRKRLLKQNDLKSALINFTLQIALLSSLVCYETVMKVYKST